MSQDGPSITIRKIGMQQFISTEALWMHGAITREEAIAMGYTPPPPPTKRQLRKWARQQWWYDHKPHIHLGPCPREDDE